MTTEDSDEHQDTKYNYREISKQTQNRLNKKVNERKEINFLLTIVKPYLFVH